MAAVPEEKVGRIKRLLASGLYSERQIAAKVGVARSTVVRVKAGTYSSRIEASEVTEDLVMAAIRRRVEMSRPKNVPPYSSLLGSLRQRPTGILWQERGLALAGD